MEMLMEWVKSGLLFTIFASVIMMICPNKTYIKHISLVIGLLFILVMIHPVMTILNLEQKTYISYIEKFLLLEGTQQEYDDNHIALYEEAAALQLTAALNEHGYHIKEITLKVLDDGTVSDVNISFLEDVGNLREIEEYVYNLFGQEVNVVYEFK